MAKLKLPFELERISTSSPAISTDAIDDRNFQKSQEEVNQIFKNSISSAETTFRADIESLSAQTSIFDENGVPVSANPISFQSNAEFVIATVDGEGRLLYGIRVDGSVYQCATDDLTQAQIDALRTAAFDTINSFSAETTETIANISTKLQELSDKIDRNWVGVEYIEEEGQINAILGDDSKIKEVTVDEDGNIVFTQLIN